MCLFLFSYVFSVFVGYHPLLISVCSLDKLFPSPGFIIYCFLLPCTVAHFNFILRINLAPHLAVCLSFF